MEWADHFKIQTQRATTTKFVSVPLIQYELSDLGSADLVNVPNPYIEAWLSLELASGNCVTHKHRNSKSLRADARRRITLTYQTQVSLQETGSGPVRLYRSSWAWSQFLEIHLLASPGSTGKDRKSLIQSFRNAGSYFAVTYCKSSKYTLLIKFLLASKK